MYKLLIPVAILLPLTYAGSTPQAVLISVFVGICGFGVLAFFSLRTHRGG